MGERPSTPWLGAALAQLTSPHGRHHVLALDEGNAFTFLETPPWIRPLLSGPRVYASELPSSWTRKRWWGSTAPRPQYKRLPMGSTHAALIVLVINMDAADRSSRRDRRCAHITCLNLEANRRTRIRLENGYGGYYVHIDDLAGITGCEIPTKLVTDVISGELEVMGFVIKRSTPMDIGRYSGLTPETSRQYGCLKL